MRPDLSPYSTMIFDCDGVILDSNQAKTEGFRTAAMPYGADAAQLLVDYHLANGGVSRYVKFKHFLNNIVSEQASIRPGEEALLAAYSDAVRAELLFCPVVNGLSALRAATPRTRWLVVSGGDQAELREVFAARNIADMFDGGIFGSPDTKEAIVAREIDSGHIRRPAIFFGDSRLDYDTAIGAGLDFVFVADWSEWADGKRFAAEGRFAMLRSLADLVEL